MQGTSERRLVVGGVTRTYLLHAGGGAKPGRPLVFVLHGWRGNAAAIEHRTRGTFDKAGRP
jgi:poly(3-hydroxybutyrate) depolymerase